VGDAAAVAVGDATIGVFVATERGVAVGSLGVHVG
jgi:hypothetical protein